MEPTTQTQQMGTLPKKLLHSLKGHFEGNHFFCHIWLNGEMAQRAAVGENPVFDQIQTGKIRWLIKSSNSISGAN